MSKSINDVAFWLDDDANKFEFAEKYFKGYEMEDDEGDEDLGWNRVNILNVEEDKAIDVGNNAEEVNDYVIELEN
tara:strand:+ start:1025 stop:1249 length:225 start_codon:yes stop_codon:yes gene_type:complete